MDAMSRLSSKESKFLTIRVSLLLRKKFTTLVLDKLILIGVTTSALYIIEKGISPVNLLGLVQ